MIFYFILPILSLAMLCSFIRLMRGPSLPDRVVALDLMATLVIGIVAVYSIATGRSAYLDVAIILALIAFLGTVAFAYYLQRGNNQQRDKNQ
ncbi:MAG: cation:proton antiporter [Deltaproteobacteria bacterium]|nr:cation:proton antiporter [Deltaproteobacteria bacterium]